jgi:hypothetical protein
MIPIRNKMRLRPVKIAWYAFASRQILSSLHVDMEEYVLNAAKELFQM